MAIWIYSLSIIFLFQSIEEESHTPSLVGLMAEVNDLTSVYNNPGALGFISVDKKFQINLLVDFETSIKIDRYYLNGELRSSFPQIILEENSIISLYVFGFYFAMKERQETWCPIIARRFGSISLGIQMWENSLNLGTLLVVNNKFRVALSGNVIYDPMQIHGRGGIIYQPLDWYYVGIDILPRLKKLRIVNAFLNRKFGLDNISIGLDIDNFNEYVILDAFVQGVFSFKYLQFAVGINSGIIKYLPYTPSGTFGFNMICSLNFGL